MLQKFQPRRLGVFSVLFDLGRFRALLRRGELGLVFAGALVGIASGCAVTAMSYISRKLHSVIYGITDYERLSSAAMAIPDKSVLFIAPIAGGIILGILLYVLSRTRKKPMVDPIEANALHGGRMSLTDSIIVAVQNLISMDSARPSGLKQVTRSSPRALPPNSAIRCRCAARICACSSAAARPAPLQPLSMRR